MGHESGAHQEVRLGARGRVSGTNPTRSHAHWCRSLLFSSDLGFENFSRWANGFSPSQRRELVRFAYLATVWQQKQAGATHPAPTRISFRRTQRASCLHILIEHEEKRPIRADLDTPLLASGVLRGDVAGGPANQAHRDHLLYGLRATKPMPLPRAIRRSPCLRDLLDDQSTGRLRIRRAAGSAARASPAATRATTVRHAADSAIRWGCL